MDHYELALKKLQNDSRSFNEIERQTGIPAETLRDIKHGITRNPRFDTLKILAKHYARQAA